MTASSLSCRTRALCISGMHRSGTSLVARLLNFAGVHLGPESELMAATAANPDGYWENIEFVKLNDQILAELGSRWDVPRPLPEGWEADERMHPLRRRAQDLIERFAGHEPWGWKDPAAFAKEARAEQRDLERPVDALRQRLTQKDRVIAKVTEEFVKTKKELGEL